MNKIDKYEFIINAWLEQSRDELKKNIPKYAQIIHKEYVIIYINVLCMIREIKNKRLKKSGSFFNKISRSHNKLIGLDYGKEYFKIVKTNIYTMNACLNKLLDDYLFVVGFKK